MAESGRVGRFRGKLMAVMLSSDMGFVLWGLFAWLYMAALAFANGVAREVVLVPMLGEAMALPLSGVIGLLLFLFLARHFVCCIVPPEHRWPYWVLGVTWALLVAVLEYGMMVGLFGRPVTDFCQVYCLTGLFNGRMVLPLLLLLLAAPALLVKLRRKA